MHAVAPTPLCSPFPLFFLLFFFVVFLGGRVESSLPCLGSIQHCGAVSEQDADDVILVALRNCQELLVK